MGKILDWVKLNAKEGANIAELEELERTMTFEGITDKNKALEIIKKDGTVFRAALDTEIQAAVKSHDERFSTEKLPLIIKEEREKIQKELNPEMTPAEKELAEMKEWKKSQEAKELRRGLEDNLRAKAKEINYPEELAGGYAVYGDKAMDKLESDAKYWETRRKADVEAEIKNLYGDIKPPRQSKSNGETVVSRDSYMAMSPQQQSDFISKGGNVIEE